MTGRMGSGRGNGSWWRAWGRICPTRRVCVWGVLAGVLMAGVVGCGGASASNDSGGVVVRVGSGVITAGLVNHIVNELKLEHRGPRSQHPGPSHQEILNEAVTSLISYLWVVGEASELGVNPSQREVQQAVNKETSRSYPTPAALQKYIQTLKEAGYNTTDLLLKARLSIASERIFAIIARKTPSHASQTQHEQTLATFIKTWREKWHAKTNCTTGYIVQKCAQYTNTHTPEDPYTLN
jgi:hypothetical protein